jgi:hypothetical protein
MPGSRYRERVTLTLALCQNGGEGIRRRIACKVVAVAETYLD